MLEGYSAISRMIKKERKKHPKSVHCPDAVRSVHSLPGVKEQCESSALQNSGPDRNVLVSAPQTDKTTHEPRCWQLLLPFGVLCEYISHN